MEEHPKVLKVCRSKTRDSSVQAAFFQSSLLLAGRRVTCSPSGFKPQMH